MTQVSSQKVFVWPFTTITINSGGTPVTVTPATSSIDDVAAAVNGANAGIKASKVPAGGGQYRLEFSANKSGAAATLVPDSKNAHLKIDAQPGDAADRSSGWDSGLVARQSILQRSQSALDVSLSEIKSQSAWLSAQIFGPSTGSTPA